jgi:NADPH:quinone reductase-like Zn-dependent oxidoreductase
MRAITLDSPDTAPRLRDDLPDPTPAGNHVVVRVHASSVNPVDNSIATGAAGEGPGRSNVMANPTPENLHRLGELLADDSLRVPIQHTYRLAQTPEALAALPTVHPQGKLAIQVN